MILAINPAVPQYKAVVTLKPVEEKPMTIKNRYKKPLIHRGNAIYYLGFWALTSLIYVICLYS